MLPFSYEFPIPIRNNFPTKFTHKKFRIRKNVGVVLGYWRTDPAGNFPLKKFHSFFAIAKFPWSDWVFTFPQTRFFESSLSF